MRIKIYIVTYLGSEQLNANLATLFASDMASVIPEVVIINNHSKFQLQQSWPVSVLHNTLRPDFSTGHLARNWNQALILGFENLESPQADIVICAQDDLLWQPNWLHTLIAIHQQYGFYTCSLGDTFTSHTAHSVRHIGLWDERFSAIAYHEADYFLRAVKHYWNLSSINDYGHNRIWNPSETIVDRPDLTISRANIVEHRVPFGSAALATFHKKWGSHIDPENWTVDHLSNIPQPQIPDFMIYPYFEKNISDLSGKGYILGE